jgi:hypothetical protein
MALIRLNESLYTLSREELEILLREALRENNNPENEIVKLITFAQLNRLLCSLVLTFFAGKYHFKNQEIWRILQFIRNICAIWQRRLTRTLSLLMENAGEEVIIIKTIRIPMDVTFDVDIVPATERAKSAIRDILCRKYGFHGERDEFRHSSGAYLSIDSYWDFNVKGRTLITHEELAAYTRSFRTENIELLLPIPEVELLLIISQIIFQDRFITLSEIFNIRHLAKSGLDWPLILRLVKRNGWFKEFSYVISIIEYLHTRLYGFPLGSPLGEIRFAPVFLPQFLILIPQVMVNPQRVGVSSLGEMKNLMRQLGIYFVKKRLPVYGNIVNIASLEKHMCRLNSKCEV